VQALEYKDFDKFDRKRWPDVGSSFFFGGGGVPAVQLAIGRLTLRAPGFCTRVPQLALLGIIPAPQMHFAGMMQYDGDLLLPRHFLVPPPLIERASEQYVVGNGLRVFACSESQKIGAACIGGEDMGNGVDGWAAMV
jgi:hypothetical protein